MSRSFETAQSMNSLNRICPPPFLSMDLNSGKSFPSNRPYSWVDELSNSDLDDWQADSDLSTQVDDSIVRLSRLYYRVDWTAQKIRVDWLIFANLNPKVVKISVFYCIKWNGWLDNESGRCLAYVLCNLLSNSFQNIRLLSLKLRQLPTHDFSS